MDDEIKFIFGIILLILAAILYWAGRDWFTIGITAVIGIVFFVYGGFKTVVDILT